jgi:anion-transporting  ArsA/GET3 family ATPase
MGTVPAFRVILAAMSLYSKRLAIVSGKGGVGKSTVSAAIGMASAGRGLRTLLIEVASQERMSLLFDQGGPIGYHATPVYPGLDAFSIDPQKALEEYLVGQLKVRVMVERLVENRAFGHVTAAAPGLRELVTLAKIRQLLDGGRHDFVVVDAPATGHGLGFLKVPRTFMRAARVGPVHVRAAWVAELLEDPVQTAVVLVTTPEELPVTETLEAIADIKDHAVPLAGVVANAVYEPLFDTADAEALAPVRGSGDAAAAAAAARARIARTADQQEQLARVRPCLAELPFLFTPRLETTAVAGLGERLGGL